MQPAIFKKSMPMTQDRGTTQFEIRADERGTHRLIFSFRHHDVPMWRGASFSRKDIEMMHRSLGAWLESN